MKKDEIESLKSSLNKANEKIVSLQGDVEAYKLSGEQMGDEINALKRQIGGFKTSNANYRRQVEKLRERVEHYKSLDIEGDELYDNKVAECEDLKKQLEKANADNKELKGQVQYYTNQVLECADEIGGLKGEIENLHSIIEYEKTPWWKKLFS